MRRRNGRALSGSEVLRMRRIDRNLEFMRTIFMTPEREPPEPLQREFSRECDVHFVRNPLIDRRCASCGQVP